MGLPFVSEPPVVRVEKERQTLPEMSRVWIVPVIPCLERTPEMRAQGIQRVKLHRIEDAGKLPDGRYASAPHSEGVGAAVRERLASAARQRSTRPM
jgi:hypothetical protein